MKIALRFAACLAVMLLGLASADAQTDGQTEVLYPSSFSISQPLRNFAIEDPIEIVEAKSWVSPDRSHRPHQTFIYTVADGPEYGNDPNIIQTAMGVRDISNRAPIQNWAGQSSSAYPPDPTGAAGPNHYVQIINATPFRIYDKTGTNLGTFTLGNLWSPATGNAGDPIVMYDQYADRWFLSQFGSSNQIYIAISTTNDPLGSYYTYTFVSPQFPDYLKFSIWENGYYMTSNQGTDKVYCFERDQMLVGNPSARAIYATFTTGSVSAFFCPLPADAADGGLPAAGTPLPFFAYYDNAWGGGTDGVKIWNMTVTWGTTPNATISAATQVNTSSFDASYDAGWDDCPQPGTTQMLDGIGGVPTYRAQWRPWSGYNSVVLNWGVLIANSPRQRAIFWCELRQDQGTGVWSVYQQGIYNPDASTRWMGSIAMDDNGSIALCYTKSASATIYPGLYYTGRLAGDALGTMSFTETTAIAGSASQTANNRYGDYSHTSMDPDGITFWHTAEYSTGSTGQETRVYSFQLPAVALPPVANFSVDNQAPSCTYSVQFTDLSTNLPTSWLWNFGDGQTSTLQNPTHTYAASGTYTVVLTATNGNGSDGETKSNYVTISMPAAPTTTGGSRCGTGTVALSATGSGTIHWYTAITGGTDLGTGASFTTPSISTTTTYYAENHQTFAPVTAGKADNSGGGANLTNQNQYLIFDCYAACTLVSIQVYASATGNRTFELRNSGGTVLASATVNITSTSGAFTVPLNFSVPVGTDLQLGLNSGSTCNLYRNNAGVTFPYTTAGYVSVTNSSAGTAYYYYFYNWILQKPDCIATPRVATVATVNPTVTPAVSISASATTICSGTSVTFTATPTNGGTPTYQWKVNGLNAGTNSSTYSNAGLANGDVVTCEMTSTVACAAPGTVTSNAVTMTVNAAVTPAVAISASATSICTGTSVTFTAVPTNGGTPSYQWRRNGANVGTNSATWTSTTLADGDVITCIMTSTAACASPTTATSNGITMTVSAGVTPAVSVTASATTICAGTSVTFTATPTNGGTPSYQWRLNGGNVGSNSATYTNAALANGDVVNCIMTSTAACATPTTATSNSVTMIVNPSVTPSVVVSASASTICAGTSVTFTAAPTNGGTPSYQWRLNGGNVGTNSTTYTNAALANGDVVNCIMTSTATCAVPATATSNNITMVVNPTLVPSVSVSASATAICTGTNVTFTAAPTNGGTPSYQWLLNGSNVGTNSATYSNAGLANGDVISCVLTSTASCASPTTATSNAVTMTVSTTLIPAVSIAASGTTICSGTNVTFTATPTNGGTPTYQWQLNGANVGSNSPTYSNNGLADGDNITCTMTSSVGCASPTIATSNTLTITVVGSITPSVSISASATTICTGTPVSFNASAVNGGTPTYQWQVNGVNTGTNSPVFISTTLADGDDVTCIITSSESCASPTNATSNTITINVSTSVTPSVSISASSGTICTGQLVDFTASPVNGGTPSYQWMVNGVNAGTNSSIYSTTNLADGDVVTCAMTSSEACATPSSATSNSLTITVTPALTPTVSISASVNDVCAGTPVTFTLTSTNGGTPTYIWLLNSVVVATNTTTYSSSTLADGDDICVVMTSSASCVNPLTVVSNAINMIIHPNVVPGVVISSSPAGPVCPGTTKIFTAIPSFGGSSPTFSWTVDGAPAGSGNTLSGVYLDGQVIAVTMTSNEVCAAPLTVASMPVTVSLFTVAPVTVTETGGVLSSSAATGNQWYEQGLGMLAGETGQTYTPTANGNYYVVVTDNNGCSATSNVFNMTTVGLTENESNGGFSIFPNPTDGLVTLTFDRSFDGAQLLVENAIGQKVYEETIQQAANSTRSVDLGSYAVGVYFIVVKTTDQEYRQKVLFDKK